MSQTLSVTEVARHFAEYINRVAYRGECFMLCGATNPLRNSGPFRWETPGGIPRTLGVAAPSLHMDAAQFAEDLTAVRETFARVEVHDPWQS